jgi:methylmalonyl-CoA/ethylmalonyl-CoA epimerase
MAGKRIDHIAFRVADLEAAVRFYTETLGFAVTDRFFLTFEDGSRARCAALKGAGEVSVFVSEGIGEQGVVAQWVREHGNALHHIAYTVDDIRAEVAALKARGVRFTTDEVLESEDLLQIFTQPIPETGVVHELIERRGDKSFSAENVRRLMESTRGLPR